MKEITAQLQLNDAETVAPGDRVVFDDAIYSEGFSYDSEAGALDLMEAGVPDSDEILVGTGGDVITLNLNSYASRNVDFLTNNVITIHKVGTYKIEIFVTGMSPNIPNDAYVRIALIRNGIVDTEMLQAIEFPPNTPVTFSMINYLDLEASEQLGLFIDTNDPNGFLFNYAHPGPGVILSVTRVY